MPNQTQDIPEDVFGRFFATASHEIHEDPLIDSVPIV